MLVWVIFEITAKINRQPFLWLPLLLESEVKSPSKIDGEWCTLQAYNAIKTSFEDAGYSPLEAENNAKRIVPNSMPEERSKRQLSKSGSARYDKFYKKDGKYYQDIYEMDTFNLNFWSNSWSKKTKEIKDFNKDIEQ